MSIKNVLIKFGKETLHSGLKLAVAGEVAKGIQKGGRAAVTKAAELAGLAKGPEKSDVDEKVWLDENTIEITE